MENEGMTTTFALVPQNQHEDLKKQYNDLQEQHHIQGNDHNRLLDEHKERYEKMQQVKEREVAQFKGADFAQVNRCREYELDKVSFST